MKALGDMLMVRFLSLLPPLAVLAYLLAAPVPAAGEEEKAHDSLRDFARTGRYTVYVDADEQSDARIYHSRRAGAFLVLDSAYGKPFLVEPRAGTVSSLSEKDVVNVSDKRADLAADVEPEELGKFRVKGRDILIAVEGLVARLKPQPYALGRLTAEELLLHTPDYERAIRRYRVSAEAAKRLRACRQDTEIVVFFGTWCPTCKRLIPRILRAEEELEGTKVRIVYHGLPKGPAFHQDPATKKYGLRAVPTAVVFRDGKAVGRLDTKDLAAPENALCFGG